MNSKIIVLILSIFGSISILFTSNSVYYGLCSQIDFSCRELFDLIEQGSYLFPLILFFSGLTWFLNNKYFRSWFRFTVISIPIIFTFVVVLNLKFHHTGSSAFNILNAIDVAIQLLLYSSYVFGSLIALFLVYRRREINLQGGGVQYKARP